MSDSNISFLVTLEVLNGDSRIIDRLAGLVGFDPVELASLRKGTPSSHFEVSMPSFGLPLAALNGLKGFNNPFAVTDNPPLCLQAITAINDKVCLTRQFCHGSRVRDQSVNRATFVLDVFINMDSLFNEVSSDESKEISRWIDGKQQEQVFAGSFKLNPMDQHVKHMMRSIDSLKNQGEYNMDTVTGSLFAKLKSVLLYTRKKYIPRVAFQTCVVMRGTYGTLSPLLQMDDSGYVLWWFKNQKPYELYVASAADSREVMKRYPAHKLSLVGPSQGPNNPGPSDGGHMPMGPPRDDDDFHYPPPPAPFSPDSDMHPAEGSGLDGPVQFQQGGQLLPQYSNPDLPLGMFPQAIEATHNFSQQLDQMQANNENMLWHGPAPPYEVITPPTPEEMMHPNQEQVIPLAVAPPPGSNPWP
eukprot:1375003-Amphidinium_carterae.1